MHTWDDLERTFHTQCGEKNYFQYYLTEFSTVKNKPSKNLREFTNRFHKLYNKIPTKIKPTPTATMVNFVAAFELDVSVMMRERRLITMVDMHSNAIEIEGNLTTAIKLRRMETVDENYGVEREKGSMNGKGIKNLKYEHDHSTFNKYTLEEKIEEMTRPVMIL